MNTISTILDELRTVCSQVSEEEYSALVQLLQEDRTFYFAGEGRSGLVAKAIAMRLMHGGKRVFVIGETTTPAIGSSDVLIVLSGSGKTAQTVHIGESAFKVGAHVFLVTTNRDALSSTWCSGGLLIPAATKHRLPSEPSTIQPLGNQFDQSAHILLDAAIIDSLQSSSLQEEMKKIHLNLE
ncbi:6-phospho-3-hexuloisomerase [Sutcliffiella halmapala]|uniref:6-phospho-3-hexuloisomerase n=1 Tax=Sutcliffiella halmapala TaxID=79882 RepID=UPI000995B197|nr:6-phospho-3-hexuloisomerase [Sutcliffiella halmapala]